MFLALLLLSDPLPDARKDALAHYAAGRLMALTDRPASAAKELEAAQSADPAAAEPKRELVRVYADLGRDAAAIRTAKAVLAADPHDFATARRLGRLLHDGRQFREAAAALTQAADSPRLDANPVERLAILREAATAGTDAGDWPGASAALTRAVTLVADRRADLRKSPRFETDAELDAEAAAVREQLGAALAGGKKFAESDTAYREAARSYTAAGDPTNAARLGWNRAKVLASAGRPADAVAVMEAFLALKPSTLPPYTDYADWLRAAGTGADAPVRLGRLADRFPGEPRIRWVVAAETARQDPAAGERLFRPLLDTSADPALAGLFVRAFAAAGRADVIAAALPRRPADDAPPADPKAGDRLRALVTAVKAEPGVAGLLLAAAPTARDWSPEVWGLVAFLAERDGKPAAAESALRQGLAADPDLFQPLYWLLRGQRRWKDVVALCVQMDGLTPGPGGRRRVPLIGYYKAVPLAELGKDAEALRTIDAAIENAARSPAVRLEKARVLLVLGRPRPAVAECDAVAADTPTPAERRMLGVIRSQAYQLMRDFPAAERELRAILDDDPDDALALNNLGYHLADEGRNLAEAEVLIRRAVEVDRAERVKQGSGEADSGTYLDSLGWVRFKRGDLAGAQAAFERAVGFADVAGDPVVWDHLGDVRFRRGDAAGARAAWEQADARYADSHVGRQFGRQAEVRRKLKLVR